MVIASNGLGNPATILLATGLNFPDALSGGAAAAKVSGAILLTNGTTQAAATSAYLASRGSATVFALGGPAAAAHAERLGDHRRLIVTRSCGAGRTAVLRRVPTRRTSGWRAAPNFPDGLTGGAHIGKLAGPLLLSDPNALPAVVNTYLVGINSTITGAFIYGGPGRDLRERRTLSIGPPSAVEPLERLRFTLVAVAGVAGLLALPAGSARAADTAIRIGGGDRIETSVAISQASYPVAGSAKAVVLARADDFADALAGTPLAVFEGGPLLVTGKDRLDVRVSQEIRRVLAVNGQVFVLGGASASSPAILGDVLTLNVNPVRIAGTDRFDTALAHRGAHGSSASGASLLRSVVRGRAFRRSGRRGHA